MDPRRWEEVERVYDAVLACEPPARAAFLRQACAGDDVLRREVESLLEYDSSADTFLERSALHETARLIGNDGGLPLPPPTIPGYTIHGLLGEGGMGVVYLAEQDEPLRRRVALKLIRPGLGSQEIVARFEAERQALAQMDHPHISAVYDAGTSEDGRPYFVMEFVAGLPIVEYCDRQRLPTRARLELFLQVCSAVQHAHQKGVIHRDLKPSNVLVSEHDGRHVAKVIDFGTAKAAASPLPGRPGTTAHGTMIGTVEYMSPEQAALSTDVDTRADVYSLGVVLYELLAGGLPFDARALRAAGYDEMRRVIRESEPPRPSDRLAQIGEAARTIADARRTDISPLKRDLAGDLDWIVLRALEKDRERRYATVAAFADDIERFLAHKPVEARSPAVTYRVGKFVRRHRFGVATSAALGVLVAGLAAITAEYSRAEGARAAADRDRVQAEAGRAAADAQRRIADSLRIAAERATTEALAGRLEADQQRARAEKERLDAQNQRALADLARQQAERASADATAEQDRAVKANEEVERLRRIEAARANEAVGAAEFRSYVAGIAAADGEIRANAISAARRRLLAIPPDKREWEWHHLFLRTDSSLATLAAPGQCPGQPAASNGAEHVTPGDDVLTPARRSRIYHRRCGTLLSWDASTLEVSVERSYPQHDLLAVNDAGQLVLSPATGDDRPTILIVDVNSTRDDITIGPLKTRPRCAAISVDGSMVVVGLSQDSSGTARPHLFEVWNTRSRIVISRFLPGPPSVVPTPGLAAPPCRAAFSPDGRLVATSDDTVAIWRSRGTGEPILDSTPAGSISQPVAFSPDSRYVAIGRAIGSVDVIEVPAGGGGQITRLDGGPIVGRPAVDWDRTALTRASRREEVSSLAFSPDGRRIVTGSATSVGIWDVTAGLLMTILPGHDATVIGAAFSGDGRRILSADASGQLRLWPADASSGVRHVGADLARGLTPTPVSRTRATSADGARVAILTDAGRASATITIWNREETEQLGQITSPGMTAIAMSANGRRVVSISLATDVLVWDADRLQVVLILPDSEGHAGVGFSNEGGIVAERISGGVTVWELRKR
jgi:serine/threonine protein kinase/WD40 repeat protein